jgi:hypothetical protein
MAPVRRLGHCRPCLLCLLWDRDVAKWRDKYITIYRHRCLLVTYYYLMNDSASIAPPATKFLGISKTVSQKRVPFAMNGLARPVLQENLRIVYWPPVTQNESRELLRYLSVPFGKELQLTHGAIWIFVNIREASLNTGFSIGVTTGFSAIHYWNPESVPAKNE